MYQSIYWILEISLSGPSGPERDAGSLRSLRSYIDIISGWWFGTFFIFPYLGNSHPNWRSYFSEGLKPPTRDVYDIETWSPELCIVHVCFFQPFCYENLRDLWWTFFGQECTAFRSGIFATCGWDFGELTWDQSWPSCVLETPCPACWFGTFFFHSSIQ